MGPAAIVQYIPIYADKTTYSNVVDVALETAERQQPSSGPAESAVWRRWRIKYIYIIIILNIRSKSFCSRPKTSKPPRDRAAAVSVVVVGGWTGFRDRAPVRRRHPAGVGKSALRKTSDASVVVVSEQLISERCGCGITSASRKTKAWRGSRKTKRINGKFWWETSASSCSPEWSPRYSHHLYIATICLCGFFFPPSDLRINDLCGTKSIRNTEKEKSLKE